MPFTSPRSSEQRMRTTAPLFSLETDLMEAATLEERFEEIPPEAETGDEGGSEAAESRATKNVKTKAPQKLAATQPKTGILETKRRFMAHRSGFQQIRKRGNYRRCLRRCRGVATEGERLHFMNREGLLRIGDGISTGGLCRWSLP